MAFGDAWFADCCSNYAVLATRFDFEAALQLLGFEWEVTGGDVGFGYAFAYGFYYR